MLGWVEKVRVRQDVPMWSSRIRDRWPQLSLTMGSCSAAVPSGKLKDIVLHEQRHHKTCLRGFRPDQTKTGLNIHRRWL